MTNFYWQDSLDPEGGIVGLWLCNEHGRRVGIIGFLSGEKYKCKMFDMGGASATFVSLDEAKKWLIEQNQAPIYSNWQDVPPHLRTRTQLRSQKLRPALGQFPVARKFWQYKRRAGYYDLYDVNHAIPTKSRGNPSDAQKVQEKEKSDAKSS